MAAIGGPGTAYRRKKPVLPALALFVVYAALMLGYMVYTAPVTVPAEYAGTAADPATYMSPEQIAKVETVGVWRRWFAFAIPAWEWLVFWTLIAGGFAARWQAALERLRLPRAVRYALYVFLVWTTASLSALPLHFANDYVYVYFGVRAPAYIDWLADYALSFALNFVAVLLLAGTAQWLMSRRRRWKLKLGLILVPLGLCYAFIYPVWIAPLYDPVKPLSDKKAERVILDLAARANVKVNQVYEKEMSSVTNVANAQVTGIGSTLRIVVWDTALKNLSEEELRYTLGHELGHYVKQHVLLQTVYALLGAIVLIAIGGWMYERFVGRWGPRFGIRKLPDMAGIPVILLLASFLTFAAQPADMALSRYQEREADRYAMELTGSGRARITQTHKFVSTALQDPNPPLLYYWWFYTHPSYTERIVYAMRFEEERGTNVMAQIRHISPFFFPPP
jgi:Zn-dependent protease with chaperone function